MIRIMQTIRGVFCYLDVVEMSQRILCKLPFQHYWIFILYKAFMWMISLKYNFADICLFEFQRNANVIFYQTFSYKNIILKQYMDEKGLYIRRFSLTEYYIPFILTSSTLNCFGNIRIFLVNIFIYAWIGLNIDTRLWANIKMYRRNL